MLVCVCACVCVRVVADVGIMGFPNACVCVYVYACVFNRVFF